jgi:hypothetical protein
LKNSRKGFQTLFLRILSENLFGSLKDFLTSKSLAVTQV